MHLKGHGAQAWPAGSDRRRDSRDSAWQAPARAGSAFRVKLVTVTVAVVTALVAAGGSLAGRRGARARRRRTRRRRPSSCATDDDCSGASLSSLMIYLGCGTPGGPGAAHAVPGPTTTTGPASRTHWARHRRRPSTVTADSDRSEHDDRRWPRRRTRTKPGRLPPVTTRSPSLSPDPNHPIRNHGPASEASPRSRGLPVMNVHLKHAHFNFKRTIIVKKYFNLKFSSYFKSYDVS